MDFLNESADSTRLVIDEGNNSFDESMIDLAETVREECEMIGATCLPPPGLCPPLCPTSMPPLSVYNIVPMDSGKKCTSLHPSLNAEIPPTASSQHPITAATTTAYAHIAEGNAILSQIASTGSGVPTAYASESDERGENMDFYLGMPLHYNYSTTTCYTTGAQVYPEMRRSYPFPPPGLASHPRAPLTTGNVMPDGYPCDWPSPSNPIHDYSHQCTENVTYEGSFNDQVALKSSNSSNAYTGSSYLNDHKSQYNTWGVTRPVLGRLFPVVSYGKTEGNCGKISKKSPSTNHRNQIPQPWFHQPSLTDFMPNTTPCERKDVTSYCGSSTSKENNWPLSVAAGSFQDGPIGPPQNRPNELPAYGPGRTRRCTLSEAISELRKTIPPTFHRQVKHLSQVDTILYASLYIESLVKALGVHNQPSSTAKDSLK